MGWYRDETFNTGYSFTTMPAESPTLYAKWSINQYQINFMINGGQTMNPQLVSYNQTITLSNPTKTGYTFVGWFQDSGLSEPFTLTQMPANDVTVYAKWSINAYTISFQSNGGTSVNNITQDYGTSVSAPTPPTKTGYTFMGWYRDEAFNTGYSFTTMPAESPTLYAKWIVEFNQINASGVISSAVSSNGKPYFWGSNSYGQLALSSFSNFSSPSQPNFSFLNPNESIRSIETNWGHSFVITNQNRVFAFGWNASGALGTTYQLHQPNVPPTEIIFSGLNPGEFVSSISGSYRNSFAITNFSNIYGWGHNGSGQLGLGHQDDVYTPTKLNLNGLNNDETIISVSPGGNYSVLLTSEGRILTFGTNADSQLGNGQRTTAITNLPTFIVLPTLSVNEKIIGIEASGSDHIFALTNQNRLIGWGSNSGNQLGMDRPPNHISTPTIIFDSSTFGLSNSESITIVSSNDSSNFTFILTSEGRVFAWGSSFSSFSITLTRNPKLFSISNLQLGEKIVSISVGNNHVIALTNLGRIFTIGSNENGQLGTGNISSRSSFSYIEVR
jgi:uncharacterized repeat protein (TIGR02543 family)